MTIQCLYIPGGPLMALFAPAERRFADTLSGMAYANPFLPEREAWEREMLGSQFVDGPRVMFRGADEPAEWDHEHPNLTKLDERNETLVSRLRERLAGDVTATPAELFLYEDLCLYLLYRRYREDLR